MNLVVQIPCLNEAQTLAGVIADVPRRIEGGPRGTARAVARRRFVVFQIFG